MESLIDGLGAPLGRLVLKVERAKKHILDLEAERDRFNKTKPYSFAPKVNPQTRESGFYLASVRAVPLSFSLILSDALNNLRSALDHTCWHLACVKSGEVRPHRDAAFPVGANAPDYQSRRQRMEACFREDAIRAINSVEPFGGGAGENIYRLAVLNNFDKHRLLLTAYSSYEGHSAVRAERELIAKFHGKGPDDYIGDFMLPRTRVYPVKAGDQLFAFPESDVDENIRFLMNIVFSEPEIVEGQPVIETLHDMANLVQSIIFAFDGAGLFT
jgi:hypothetical protein